MIESFNDRVASSSSQGSHVQDTADRWSATFDETFAAHPAAIVAEGSQAHQCGDLFAIAGSKFRQLGGQGSRSDFADAGYTEQEILPIFQARRLVNQRVNSLVQFIQLPLEHSDSILDKLKNLKNLRLKGLHFHIGSQITDLDIYKSLCHRVNEINAWFIGNQVFPEIINLGGGLGIDYGDPEKNRIPDFSSYFRVFKNFIELQGKQELHFEPGRAIVGQCGSLITKVLFVKKGVNTWFAIVDAGMNDLIRPALYQSYHKIENITSVEKFEKYDVVGPICESSDCFGKALPLAGTHRNDLLAIRSTGAYGQTMASQYNLRSPAATVYSDEL